MHATEKQGANMTKITENTTALDFALADLAGQTVRLSDFRGQKHIVLVFNRGFT